MLTLHDGEPTATLSAARTHPTSVRTPAPFGGVGMDGGGMETGGMSVGVVGGGGGMGVDVLDVVLCRWEWAAQDPTDASKQVSG
jgi:hypothetical protein